MAFSLTDVARTAKSELVLILLGIIAVSLVTFTVYSFTKSTPDKNTQRQTNSVAWNGLSPGISTKNDVLSNLGSPLEVKTEGNTESLLYSSSNEFRPHELQISQGTTQLIKEQIVNSKAGDLDEFIRKYGRPESIIYGQHGTFAPAHFWGQHGLLVFAGTNDGVVIEIWYFPAQTISTFLQKFPNFTTEPVERHESY